MRVWLGSADLGTDHLAARKNQRERDLQHQYQIKWPKNDDLRKLLGRVAVPLQTAYELWGWGSVAEVVQLRVVQCETGEPTDWPQLVAFRHANVGTEWKPNQKNIAATEANRRKESPGATGVAKAMAEELSITVSRFNDLVRSANSEGKRAAARSNAA